MNTNSLQTLEKGTEIPTSISAYKRLLILPDT